MTASPEPAAETRVEALPKSWDPGAVEHDIYQSWVDAGYFTADPTSAKPGFSMVLPPPNVTGDLHMGHALEHTLMDALARRKRMQGFEVLWQPGMDHAGIATQSVVEKQLAVDWQDQGGLRPRAVHRQGVGLEAKLRRSHRWPDASAR